MNQNKRIIAMTMAAVTLLANTGTAVFAADVPTEKEEVIYAMLGNDGEVTGVYAVNSFAGGDIVDYGNYTGVRNLTTEDEINQDGEKITIHTDADKVYYQGDLDTKNIPWNIDITYKLDGKEYTAEEIAGKSGALEINISITQNDKCDEAFWEGHALQATLVLDGNLCKNIEADNATIANVGSDKQLSYIVLPGKGADITVKADVMDFSMDEITINGVKMNLDMDIDDSSITDKIAELQDAVTELDDGAGELADGTKELKDGASSLKDGTKELKDGADEVNTGASTLASGASTLKDGAGSVNTGASQIASGAQSVNEGMSSLTEAMGQLKTALETLDGNSSDLTKGSSEVLNALTTIQTSLASIDMDTESLSSLVTASGQIKTGIDGLVNGLETVDGSIGTYQESVSSALSAAGISDMNAYVEAHSQAVAALGITDTMRSMYAAYVSGGEAGVMQQMTALVSSGDAEAMALYQAYVDAGNDASVITDYVTEAGRAITIETLLAADASYIAGSNELISGIDASLDSENGALMSGAKSLQSNYVTFDAGIQSLATEVGKLPDELSTLKQGIDTLVKNYKTLDSGITDYTDAVSEILKNYKTMCTAAGQLEDGTSSLLNGAKSLATGTSSLVDGAASLKDGADSLATGTSSLLDGSNELYDGSKDLYDGVEELQDGVQTLNDGTSEFKDKTDNMDQEITDTIDSTISEMTGEDVPTVSFVSDKNTNVDSVLFVMKTPAIEVPEEEEVVESEPEATGFWQKLLNLFGL